MSNPTRISTPKLVATPTVRVDSVARGYSELDLACQSQGFEILHNGADDRWMIRFTDDRYNAEQRAEIAGATLKGATAKLDELRLRKTGPGVVA